jgi:hypothetical protein
MIRKVKSPQQKHHVNRANQSCLHTSKEAEFEAKRSKVLGSTWLQNKLTGLDKCPMICTNIPQEKTCIAYNYETSQKAIIEQTERRKCTLQSLLTNETIISLSIILTRVTNHPRVWSKPSATKLPGKFFSNSSLFSKG